MSEHDVDAGRRNMLRVSASVVGVVGGAAALIPFVSTMSPSAKALAAGAPVEVDISKLEVGQKIQVEWRRKPVWIVRRSDEMLANLGEVEAKLRDPSSELSEMQPPFAQNSNRSIKPEVLVLVGICTHLGCSPTFRPELAPADLGPEWKGGFYCPCHGSRFDISGRVYKNMPANDNLEVPPYKYLSDNVLRIGEMDEEQGVA
ncbi:MAG: ubiquinol-cytochrome c reductase iron-sulfur subunit [Gammaproteobacteria bacterium TMED119]|nr:MAG: ubiquinol-cytochrome c reductase iron-sulfur subunit [Gammaproteobacteria bacterium TMED119]RCL47253.1 MAG: ubiquinol-cytochrome c reductase iron-sulfur subunit [Candidatus Thioglobus sp.]|tara:strand:+ start:1059 stop:1664 length:606 start_codon:yes stop_codon:yes gene_type:complete